MRASVGTRDEVPKRGGVRARARARAARSPQSPRRFAGGPQVVEDDGVLVRVHAVPEALVAERAQLALCGEALERGALEHAVVLEILERAGVEAEEAAVDPVLRARLLAEAADD